VRIRSETNNAVGDESLHWSLLESMILVRIVEEKLAAVYPNGVIRTPMHLCVGQEAVPVAVSSLLEPGDVAFSGHRSHGHYLAQGGSLVGLFAELLGRSNGCCKGLGGSQHLSDPSAGFLASAPILAGTVPVAVGYAWKQRSEGRGRISVTYFGDAVVEEGIFHESVSFAALHKLPVLFVCENNLYSVHAHLSVRQPSRSIRDLVTAHGIHSLLVDGNDVLAIRDALRDVLQKVRDGLGPIFLEASTYRMLEHVGPSADWNLGYRAEAEGIEWKRRDPIDSLKNWLGVSEYDSARARYEAVLNRVNQVVEDAYQEALRGSLVDYAEIKTWLYPSGGSSR